MFEVIIIIGTVSIVGILVYLYNPTKKREYNNHKDDVIHNLCY